MPVALPLRDILHAPVVTVTVEASVADALAVMESRRISCVVAADECGGKVRPLGIFTEQDAIRLLAGKHRIDTLGIAAVMSKPPLVVAADLDYREAFQRMASQGFRHLIVADADGALVGVVSEGDFLHHLGMDYLVELKTVAASMTRDPRCLEESATLADAVALMAAHHISCVPVVRGGRPVGILSERDVVGLARWVEDAATVPITGVMKGPVQTVDADCSLQDAACRMEAEGIRRLVVVDGDGAVVGLVTRHDIVKALQGRYIEFLHRTVEQTTQELRSAREELATVEQKALLTSLFDQVNDAIYVSDPVTGALVAVSTQACATLGYAREELLARPVQDIVEIMAEAAARNALMARLARGEQVIVDTRHIRSDGSRFPVEISLRRADQDLHGYLVWVARDLSRIRRQEAQLRLLGTALEASANAVVITDAEVVIQWVNPAFSTLTGYAPDEAIGRQPRDLLKSGMHPPEFYADMWRTIGAGQVWRGEVVNRRKDGSLYHEAMTITPVLNAEGQCTHYIAIKEDISAQRQAVADLHRSEERLALVLKGSNDAAWDWDLAADKLYYSPRWWEMLGLQPGEETDDAGLWQRLLHPDDAPRMGQFVATTLASPRTSFEVEFRLRHRDGHYVPLLCRGCIVRDGEGKPLRVAGSNQDLTRYKEMTAALRESESRYRSAFHTSPDAVNITRLADGRYIDVNEGFCRMTGWAPAEVIGRTAVELGLWHNPDDRGRLLEILERKALCENLEARFVKKNGEVLTGLMSAQRIVVGGEACILTITRDISERKAMEERLRQTAVVIDTTREGVVVTDPRQRITMVNRAFCELTGYSEAEAIGQTPAMLRSGRHGDDFYEELWRKVAENGHWQGEIWNRRKNGEIFPELLSINAVHDESGALTHYVGVFADISKLKDSEARLEYLAHHDPLTGLPNRLMMLSRLQHSIEVARREGTSIALLMLDLDRFKDVNDSFGHLAGDELLQQVAARLTARLRGGDTVTRLGGDEFTVLLEHLSHPEDAARVADDIIASLSDPCRLESGTEVRVGASVGISLYPGYGDTAEAMLQQADAALYGAKTEGRGRFKYFSDELTLAARRRIELEGRLRRAVAENELRVYYQPQVDIASGRIIGAEALVRWQDPRDGLVSPDRFIPVAEETGLIAALGEWVLRETCRQGMRWLKAGLPSINLAVNLSPHQLRHGNIVATLAEILKSTGFPARHLELELTENAFLAREDESVAILHGLRALGLRLAIDDFGTGYSSLAYLKRFPVDVIKIDKSFVDDIPFQQDDMEIAATIIAMGHNLGFHVLAEGVETPEQLAFLAARGCDHYQGYLRSPPLPAGAFEQLLAAEA